MAKYKTVKYSAVKYGLGYGISIVAVTALSIASFVSPVVLAEIPNATVFAEVSQSSLIGIPPSIQATRTISILSVPALSNASSIVPIASISQNMLLVPAMASLNMVVPNIAIIPKGTILLQAIKFEVDHTVFDNAYAALDIYLNTTLDIFADMSSATTGIVRTIWDAKWKDYYNARTDLLNAIATKAKALADAAQATAGSAMAEIVIQAGQISSKVSSTDYDGITIMSKVNQTASAYKIDAKNIDLNGLVTITDLSTAGATTINGSNITTGTLTGVTINAINNISIGSTTGPSYLTLFDSTGKFGSINADNIRGMNINSQAGGIRLSCTDASPISTDNKLGLLGSNYPQIYGNGTVLQLSHNDSGSNGVIIEASQFRPAGNGTLGLGAASYRWGQIYSTVGTISTSDGREKNTIKSLDAEKTINFIMALNPVSYKFNDGTSGRTHYGLVSQDVEDALVGLSMTSTDFGGFIKSPKEKETIVVNEEGKETRTKETIPNEYVYGLRYEEFIAPLITTVQQLQKQIYLLHEKISILEAK